MGKTPLVGSGSGCARVSPARNQTRRSLSSFNVRPSTENPSLVRSLERQAILSQLFPALPPSLVLRTFRVIRGGLRTGEFDRIDAVEALNLISLRLEPNVFDSGDLSGHGLNPVQRLILVVLGIGVLPLVD